MRKTGRPRAASLIVASHLTRAWDRVTAGRITSLGRVVAKPSPKMPPPRCAIQPVSGSALVSISRGESTLFGTSTTANRASESGSREAVGAVGAMFALRLEPDNVAEG